MFTVTPSSPLSDSNFKQTIENDQKPIGTASAPSSLQGENYLTKNESQSCENIVNMQKIQNPESELVPRLENLYQCIVNIIKGYSTLPHCPNIYINSLNHFLKLTENLLYYLKDNKKERRGSYDSIEDKQEELNHIWLNSNNNNLNLGIEIEKLENDWWNSEVVASWYGPRPRPRNNSNNHPINSRQVPLQGINGMNENNQNSPKSSSAPNLPSTSKRTFNPSPTTIRKGMNLINQNPRIRIGSNDLSALREETDSDVDLDATYGPNDGVGQSNYLNRNQGNVQIQGQMAFLENVGKLRRDSSYVGLNDE